MNMKIQIQTRDSKVVALNPQRLVDYLLKVENNETRWRDECVIIVDYVPKGPNKTPMCVISHPQTETFLRYSRGPAQGYFWDCYGEDFIHPELALVALSRAQRPCGKPYVEFRIPLDL